MERQNWQQEEELEQDKDEGGYLLTLTDDDGEEYVLEHLDTIELDGRYFMAFLPADMDPEDDDYGLVLMEAFPGEGG